MEIGLIYFQHLFPFIGHVDCMSYITSAVPSCEITNLLAISRVCVTWGIWFNVNCRDCRWIRKRQRGFKYLFPCVRNTIAESQFAIRWCKLLLNHTPITAVHLDLPSKNIYAFAVKQW